MCCDAVRGVGVCRDQLQVVQLLLQHKVNVNGRVGSRDQETALILASRRGQLQLLQGRRQQSMSYSCGGEVKS